MPTAPDAKAAIHALLKHGLHGDVAMAPDDPFVLHADGLISKGRLCEIIADAVVDAIAAGRIPGIAIRGRRPGPRR